MECFICKESPHILYKLCNCISSTICVDCYDIDLSQNMTNCALCRKRYKFIKKRDYNKTFSILKKKIPKICFLLVDLIIPAYLYYHNPIELIFCLIFLFNILFINNTNFYLLKSLYPDEFLNSLEYKRIKTICIMSKYVILAGIASLIYIFSNYALKIYFYGIQLPIYIIPFIFFNFVFLKKIFDKFLVFLNNNTLTSRIKVKSIVYQDTTIV